MEQWEQVKEQHAIDNNSNLNYQNQIKMLNLLNIIKFFIII